jgi:hypothetical protein
MAAHRQSYGGPNEWRAVLISLFREMYFIYNPHAIQPGSLFWRCVWVAFILSSISAWTAEYRRSESLGRELAAAKAHPSFVGHLYQFNIHPRGGITPPKMMQEALDIFAESSGKPKAEYTVDCDVFHRGPHC